MSFIIHHSESGSRLQDVLAARFPTVSVGALRRLMTNGRVLLNGVQGTRNMLVAAGDSIELDLPEDGLPGVEP